MLLYIHGFGSCGRGNKIDCLRGYFGADEVLAPDLPPDPEAAMALLEGLIAVHPVDLLVGSSLGGYYAEWLNGQHQIPSVLINPSTDPFHTLASLIGPNHDWCSGEIFYWRYEHLQKLQLFRRSQPELDERYLVLLQTGDETLDYRLAAKRYSDFDVVIETGGNHRFENMSEYLSRIEAFYKASVQ